ncbi:MAG: hypothetical protein M0P57_15155 [Syntrophales bacterium]|nr:hypothetical protein [Syntrophales bacterium]
MKVLAGIIGGLILAIGAILVTVTFAASPEKGGSWGGNQLSCILDLGRYCCCKVFNRTQGMAKTAHKFSRSVIPTSVIRSDLHW